MSTIKKIAEKNEKTYIIFKSNEARQKFVSEALREGITYTDGALPHLLKTDDVIVLYCNGTIAHLGWAGRVKFNNRPIEEVFVDFEEYLNNI